MYRLKKLDIGFLKDLVHSLVFFPPSLQLLLRKKAAEELKKEQERKAAERRKIIDQRCGQPKNLEGANEGIVLVKGRRKS